MDTNGNAAQDGAGTGSSSGVGPNANANADWRLELQPDDRQRIVNKIVETLRRHVPVPVTPEMLNAYQTRAAQFEEGIYNAAANRPEYLDTISRRILFMSTEGLPGFNASP